MSSNIYSMHKERYLCDIRMNGSVLGATTR